MGQFNLRDHWMLLPFTTRTFLRDHWLSTLSLALLMTIVTCSLGLVEPFVFRRSNGFEPSNDSIDIFTLDGIFVDSTVEFVEEDSRDFGLALVRLGFPLRCIERNRKHSPANAPKLIQIHPSFMTPSSFSQDLRGYRPRIFPLLLNVLCLCVPSLIFTSFATFLRQRAKRRLDRIHIRLGFCPQCKYNLHGNQSAGCPECGWAREEYDAPKKGSGT